MTSAHRDDALIPFPEIPADGAPATEEELRLLALPVNKNYPLEVLRRNRRIAFPALELIGRDADAREKWRQMGLPGALPRRPKMRWRLDTYRDWTGTDDDTNDEGVEVVVFATQWAKAGLARQSQQARLNVVRDTLHVSGPRGFLLGVNLWESGEDTPESPCSAWGEGMAPDGTTFLVHVTPLSHDGSLVNDREDAR